MTWLVTSTEHYVNVYEAKKNKSEYINKRQKCAITVMENFYVVDL